jgi:hypothetical protein
LRRFATEQPREPRDWSEWIRDKVRREIDCAQRPVDRYAMIGKPAQRREKPKAAYQGITIGIDLNPAKASGGVITAG